MGWANYKAPLQAFWLKICYRVRVAALVAEPYPSRRGDHPWHRPPRRTTLLAAFNPGQHEEVWQGVGHGNRQRQQKRVQGGNIPRFLWRRKRTGRGRRRQKQRQHRTKQYFKRDYKLRQQEREKYFMGQCPCPSSSNGCRRQRRQHRLPVHGPQREQPGKTCWQGHCWRSNQRRQKCTKPLHQDQAGGQRGGGQEEMLFWNMKKRCWVTTSYLPAAMLRQASTHLRPMNMAGFCLPGMRVPHNTSQYIMDQHEFPWKNEEEVVAAMSGGNGNYSTEGEDFLLTVQEDEGVYTEEEEEESTQVAWQD